MTPVAGISSVLTNCQSSFDWGLWKESQTVITVGKERVSLTQYRRCRRTFGKWPLVGWPRHRRGSGNLLWPAGRCFCASKEELLQRPLHRTPPRSEPQPWTMPRPGKHAQSLYLKCRQQPHCRKSLLQESGLISFLLLVSGWEEEE